MKYNAHITTDFNICELAGRSLNVETFFRGTKNAAQYFDIPGGWYHEFLDDALDELFNKRFRYC